MNKIQLITATSLVSLALAGCGGGGSSSSGGGSAGGSDGGGEGGGGTPSTQTTFNVTVDDGKGGGSIVYAGEPDWLERIAGLVIPTAWAEPVGQLDPSQFTIQIIGEPEPLDPSEYTVTDLGGGAYQVVVPGDPRFDCYIATDLDGDGTVDLRAPTVNENLSIDPASEFVTRLVEQNAARFNDFGVDEVAQILADVQTAVAGNEELAATLGSATTVEEALTAIETELGTITEQLFDTAAATASPEETDLAALAGDYHFIGYLNSLARIGESAGDVTSHPYDNYRVEKDIWVELSDGSISRNGSDISLNLSGWHEIGTVVDPGNSTSFVNYDESGTGSDSVNGVVTSTGLRVDIEQSTADYSEGQITETETEEARSIGFTGMNNGYTAFIGSSLGTFTNQGYDGQYDSSWNDYSKEYGLFFLGKKQQGFAAADADGDWGMVAYEKTLDIQSGALTTRVEATPLSILSGTVDATSSSAFEYEFVLPLDFSPAQNGGSFDPQSASGSDTITFNADGSFSFDTSATESSNGMVFPGNQMMMEVYTDHPSPDRGTAGVYVAVKRAANAASLLQGRNFKMRGLMGWNGAGTIEMAHVGNAELSFDAAGTAASLSVLDTWNDLELEWGTLQGGTSAFTVDGWSVAVSSDGLVQLEVDQVETDPSGDLTHHLELNGFVSEDGRQIVLVLANLDDVGNQTDPAWEPEGSLGMLVGTCTNCN